MPATLFLNRSPRSYTGDDLVEVHTIGSPPILELILSAFITDGARLALPGEFTMRAFLNGKLDLTAAEAVLGLIEARSPEQAAMAQKQLAGGIAQPIQRLRDRLLDLLAELEAGLDFVDDDIEFVDRDDLRRTLDEAIEEIGRLERQMHTRAVSDVGRRVVLVGPPNVGKSSLFNALLGRNTALVSQVSGTTRDYLVSKLQLQWTSIELVDTAGIETPATAVDQKAQVARENFEAGADLLLWCLDSRDVQSIQSAQSNLRDGTKNILLLLTKSDLVPISKFATPNGTVSVSALTGAGLEELRNAIEDWLVHKGSGDDAVVPMTAARCYRAISGALAATQRANDALDAQVSDELIALELRLALDELAHVVGAVYTDDILDRIFSRFCIGK